MSKSDHRSHSSFEGAVDTLDGKEGAEQLPSGENLISEPIKRWREENGVIYITVTLDQLTSGKDWIARTSKKGNRLHTYAKRVLLSKSFHSSDPGTYEIAILKASLCASDDERFTKAILIKGKELNFQTPNIDIGCLICEQFTDKEIEEMGFEWIAIMHKPIKFSDSFPGFLAVVFFGDDRWITMCRDRPGFLWDREVGLAFLRSRVM